MAALSRRIFGPVEALTRAARRMEGGDLSQRVAIRSPDEIGELAHAFNSLAGALERGEILRRGMVSDVAHELRTPLTNIRCQIESLQDGLVTADRAALDSLHDETMLLSRLVEDLQELSLAEAGGIRLDLTRVSVDDAVRSAAGAIAPRAREANVRLVIEPGEAPKARADPNRVAQVLRILLDNAVAHTPSGGEIRVRTLAAEGVRVEVSDTGAGIPREHLPHIFERFYRADPSRARETGGAGLGLAIARQLAQAQGGSISVESDPGRGTTFTVTLPRASPLP
jgi:signal transduction histidine kinase